MGDQIFKILRNFIVFSAIQILIANNIGLFGFATPYIYLITLLALPIGLDTKASLTIGFIVGITIDIFSYTAGLHAFSCVLMMYSRSLVIKILAPRDEYVAGTNPGIQNMGLNWFLGYSAALILIHHVTLYVFDAFRWIEIFSIIGKSIVTTVFSLVMVILIEYLLYNRSAKE